MSAPQRAHPGRPRAGLSPSLRLALRFDPRAPLTDRLLRLLSGANSDLRLERTDRGELIVMPPAGAETGGRNIKIAYQLCKWVEVSGLGVSFDSSTGFRLPNGAVRSPDASWVERDRWDALSPNERKGFAPLCPDFAVELRSPSDQLRQVRDKMREYRAQGTRIGWLIDPKRKVVEVYRPRRRVEVLTAPVTLTGEDVLPGFVLDLKGILT